MEDSISLEQPAGLRLNDVDGLASWSRRCPIAQGRGADLVNVANVAGIEQRFGIFYFDGLSDSGDRERD